MTTAIQDNIRNAIENFIEPFININFQEVTSGGDIRYSFDSDSDYAHAHPEDDNPFTTDDGSIHLNPDYTSTFKGGVSSYGFATLIDETLHILGLKHSWWIVLTPNPLPQGEGSRISVQTKAKWYYLH